MAEMWDDAALVSAFNDALNKYEVKHKKKNSPTAEPETNADASVLEETAEEEEVNDQQTEDQQRWDSYYQQFPQQQFSYPYPYPAAYPYPYPYPVQIPPAYFPPFPGYGNHFSPAASGSNPSYESLKAAVLKALSELPADRKLSLEENSNSTEVLMAWFNAGFRTASYLTNK